MKWWLSEKVKSNYHEPLDLDKTQSELNLFCPVSETKYNGCSTENDSISCTALANCYLEYNNSVLYFKNTTHKQFAKIKRI